MSCHFSEAQLHASWRSAAAAVGMRHMLIRLLPMSVLAGCASANLPTRPDPSPKVIEFMDEIRKGSTYNIDSALTRSLRRPVWQETPTAWTWRGWWCPVEPSAATYEDVRPKVAEFCLKTGGTMDKNVACVDPTYPERVLFLAIVTTSGLCAKGKQYNVVVNVVAPRPGFEATPSFHSVLSAYGYRPTEVDRRERVAQQQAKAARLAAELPLLRTRGTRVCTDHKGLTYVGFVEDVNVVGTKIRIDVKGTRSGITPGGWQPGTTWDSVENWYVCE